MTLPQKQLNFNYFNEITSLNRAHPKVYSFKFEIEKSNVTREDIEKLYRSDYDESFEGKEVTEDEYWEHFYYDTPYEWNCGRLEVKPLADYLSGLIHRWFVSLLSEFSKYVEKIQIVGNEMGFKMLLPQGIVIRKPDIGLICENSTQMGNLDRNYKSTFDVCVEFLSDSTKKVAERDIYEKKVEYETGGVKEYYIIDREGRHTYFFRLENGVYKDIKPVDGVIKSKALKGFQFRIEHLYSMPDLHDLIDDPVYKNFVCLKYQEERAEKEKEKQRADINEYLLKEERKKLEILTLKLKELTHRRKNHE